jgi:RNA polymerase sigma-70 factor (ECF subfamily)
VSPSAGVQPEPGFALLDLYDEALPQVYGYLLSRCRRRALAEDLTAETFLAAVTACRAESPPELSVAWLVGVARHKLADHWRHAEREERGLRAVAAEPEPAGKTVEEHLDVLLAREALATLAPQHRAALTLRYLDGLGVPAVAEHLGRTTRATEALLVRARTAFRRAYEEMGLPGKEGRDD